MDRTRGYHLTSGVQRRGAEGPGSHVRGRGLLGAVGRIAAVTVAASLVGVPVAFFLVPVPADADAVTLCLPGVGPVQQYADGLEGDLGEVVRIHELMHVQQCRSLGAVAWYRTYGSREGRMRLEAEAYCAEIDILARRGMDPEALLEPRVRILHAGYGNDDRMSVDEVRALMRATCRFSSGARAAVP